MLFLKSIWELLLKMFLENIMFLDKNKILWLFYKVMPATDEETQAHFKTQEEEARAVDRILLAQAADFLTQSSTSKQATKTEP